MTVRAGRHAAWPAADSAAPVAPGPTRGLPLFDRTLRPGFRGGSASPLTRLLAQALLGVWVFLGLPVPSQRAIVI